MQSDGTDMEDAPAFTEGAFPSPLGGGGFRVRIGGDELAPRQARRELASLRCDLDPGLLDTTQLLVTELVTNSVRHAGADAVELAVAVMPERVRVEVANPGRPFLPRPREDAREPDPGWGLFLVDRLSDAWGVAEDAGRQRVWFELSRA